MKQILSNTWSKRERKASDISHHRPYSNSLISVSSLIPLGLLLKDPLYS